MGFRFDLFFHVLNSTKKKEKKKALLALIYIMILNVCGYFLALRVMLVMWDGEIAQWLPPKNNSADYAAFHISRKTFRCFSARERLNICLWLRKLSCGQLYLDVSQQ